VRDSRARWKDEEPVKVPLHGRVAVPEIPVVEGALELAEKGSSILLEEDGSGIPCIQFRGGMICSGLGTGKEGCEVRVVLVSQRTMRLQLIRHTICGLTEDNR